VRGFENPLMPTCLMKGMYRALVETRHLTAKMAPKNRLRDGLPRGLEACWVSPAIDLRVDDVVLTPCGFRLVEHIARVGQRRNAGAARRTDLRAALFATGPSPFPGTEAERLLAAMGAALTLQRQARGGAVLVWVYADDLSKSQWRRILSLTASGHLPLILIVLPRGPGSGQVHSIARALAKETGAEVIPVIPVDGTDAIALYRVSQEALGRTRSEGGLVVIECLASDKDPVSVLAKHLCSKKICKTEWVTGVASDFKALALKS